MLEPELAESWQVAPDGKSVTFKLRKDAKFHDGTPVTAKDVKWSFDRAVTVGGFPTFQMAAGSLEKPEQFEAVDDHTFRVKFLRKDKLTMPDLAVPVPVIINSELAKKHATRRPLGAGVAQEQRRGGGAYQGRIWGPGQETSTCASTTGSRARCQAEARIVREVPSAGNRRALLERGDTDISFDLPPKDFAELAKAGKVKVVAHAGRERPRLPGHERQEAAFDNLKVRQAVAYAMPYEKIFATALYGRGVAVGGNPSRAITVGHDQPVALQDRPRRRPRR